MAKVWEVSYQKYVVLLSCFLGQFYYTRPRTLTEAHLLEVYDSHFIFVWNCLFTPYNNFRHLIQSSHFNFLHIIH